MDIYFAGAIYGGRELQPIYEAIVQHLKSSGHSVLSEHVAHRQVLEQEASLSLQEIYARDIKWLDLADAVVAEVSLPSLGVGYEISFALERQKPVLCLHREGTRLSAMIAGNDASNLTVQAYDCASRAVELLDSFLTRQK